jgi:shikimate kinase
MVHHVVLVGLMGSGKTTVGRRLAAHLERDFVDADDALEAITDRTIAEIFATDGEEAFRAIESVVFEELLEHHRPSVIASGGGLVLGAANRRRLRQPGVTVVWLDGDPAFLAGRVKAKSHRPLLAGAEPIDEVIHRLHAERAPLYREVADIVVSVAPFHRTEERPKEATAERVAALVLAHEARAQAQEEVS